MKIIRFLLLIAAFQIYSTFAHAQSSSPSDADHDLRISQLVKTEFQALRERESLAADKQKKIFESTIDLLENLKTASGTLANDIEKFQMMLSIANTTSPVGDVGYDIERKFNSAFNDLIDKKPASMMDDADRRRLKGTLRNIVGLMQDNFPAVNVIASALTTFASYTKPTSTGGFSPQIQNPAVFSEQELDSLRKSFSDDFKFFNDLKFLNERYLSLSNQALLQTQQNMKKLESANKKLIKSISTQSASTSGGNLNSIKNQYFSNNNSELGLGALYRYSLAQDALAMNIEFQETIEVYELMIDKYRSEMKTLYDSLIALGADINKIKRAKEALDGKYVLSKIWSPQLTNKADEVESALIH